MRLWRVLLFVVLVLDVLPFGQVIADSTNSVFGITMIFPATYSFAQQDVPAKTITLAKKSGEQIIVMTTEAGVMQPEDLAQITIGAFHRGRSLRKEQGTLSELKMARQILGARRYGTQFQEVSHTSVRWSEFYSFRQRDRIYLVSLQWQGTVGKSMPSEISSIIESMTESYSHQRELRVKSPYSASEMTR